VVIGVFFFLGGVVVGVVVGNCFEGDGFSGGCASDIVVFFDACGVWALDLVLPGCD
jgi:hypothetical protein